MGWSYIRHTGWDTCQCRHVPPSAALCRAVRTPGRTHALRTAFPLRSTSADSVCMSFSALSAASALLSCTSKR